MATKTKKKGGGLASKFKSQVGAEAALRYGPQAAVVRQSEHDLADQLVQGIAQEHAGARGQVAAAQAARPQIERSYEDAATSVAATEGDLANRLSGLSSAADGLKAAALRDSAGTTRRLAEALATARSELTARALDAKAGETYAIRNLQDRISAQKATLRSKLADIAGQRGTYAAARTGALVEADRGRRHDTNKTRAQQTFTAKQNAKARKNARLVGGIDDSGKKIPGGAKDKPAKPGHERLPGGAKPVSATAHTALADSVAAAREQVKRLKAEGRSRSEIAGILRAGRPSQTITDDKGNKLKIPTVPVTKQSVGAIALDLEFDKHLSGATVKRLHDGGFVIKKLGWATAKTAPKPARKSAGGVKIKDRKPSSAPAGGDPAGRFGASR